MIVKFDHISYVSEKDETQSVLKEQGTPRFCETDLENIEIKKDLMSCPQDSHDLYFYDNDYPIEYIFYDRVGKQTGIRFDGNIVYGSYYDFDGSKDFLEELFRGRVSVNGDKIVCNMKGVLDKKDYLLVLEPSKNDKPLPCVDDSGYGIPALIVSGDYRHLNKPDSGCICTEWNRLSVNGKELNICFIRSNCTNVIFEMIRPEK